MIPWRFDLENMPKDQHILVCLTQGYGGKPLVVQYDDDFACKWPWRSSCNGYSWNAFCAWCPITPPQEQP